MSNGSRPTVDVVIPVRDGARFLGTCLDSVLAQTYPLDGVFVVDDGSQDESPEIAAAYAKRDARIRVIRTEPRGLPHARNAGIRAGSAEFVAFVDSDDIWKPEKIERQMAVFGAASNDVGFVHCSFYPIDETGADLDSAHIPVPSKRGDIFFDLIDGYSLTGSGSAVVVRRSLLLRVGGFDESLTFGEDFDLWLRLAKVSHVDYVADALVGIHEHAGSMQRRHDPTRKERSFLSRICALEKFSDDARGNEKALAACLVEAVKVGLGRILRRREGGFYPVMHSRAPAFCEAMFVDARGYRRYIVPASGLIIRHWLSTVVARVARRSRLLLWCCHRMGKLKHIELPQNHPRGA